MAHKGKPDEVEALRGAVALVLPVITGVASRIEAASPADAALLRTVRAQLSRAFDRLLSDTQPIDVDERGS